MFQVVSPAATIGLAVVPFELALAVPTVVAEVTAVYAFMVDLYAMDFQVIFKPALKDRSLADVDAKTFPNFGFAFPKVKRLKVFVGHNKWRLFCDLLELGIDHPILLDKLRNIFQLLRQSDTKHIGPDTLLEQLLKRRGSISLLPASKFSFVIGNESAGR